MAVQYFSILDDIAFIDRGGWKIHPKFGDYVSTLTGLDDKEKIKQNNKRTHFIWYTRESLVTHFSQCATILLFLSLYPPQPTATCVARMIMRK